MPLTTIAIKKYSAKLTQSGTNAPTAIVQQNTIGGTPVWTRVDVGRYQLTITGAFKEPNKVQVLTRSTNGESNGTVADDNTIEISTLDATGTPTDNYLYETPINILVYKKIPLTPTS